uniref:Chaperonin HSP60, mitochondrial n=1 Tax=Lygus hesperus TaxID=30085 RepID=A0A0A9YZH0_LYGHE
MAEVKDRVIDALNASRRALVDGVVAGGGAALLHASKKLDELLATDEDMDQDKHTGVQIVRNAIRLPTRTISENAGEEGAVTVENVLEYQDTAMGYDAQNGEYVNMFDAGIVDPICVVKSCIVDAASVAGLMITTEASVCDDQSCHSSPLTSLSSSSMSSSLL